MMKKEKLVYLQFGEGNFMRAFVDDFISEANAQNGENDRVALVQPIAFGRVEALAGQDFRYHLFLRGEENGEVVSKIRKIDVFSCGVDPYRDYNAFLALAKEPELRFVLSNTTEAGIAFDPAVRLSDEPPASFPGKLCAFLFARFEHGLPGLVMLPSELIDHNAEALKEAVLKYAALWELPEAFVRWIHEENEFHSTLVDRIVPGYPKEEEAELWARIGCEDPNMVFAEPFGLWLIEGDEKLKEALPFEKAGLPVHVVPCLDYYKMRKVRILNGIHTMTALAAYAAGLDTVREMVTDPAFSDYIERTVASEIIPAFGILEQEGIPDVKKDLNDFYQAVLSRFRNPFIRHKLLSISLNSVSKWRTRVLPSVLDYARRFGRAPEGLAASLSGLLAFYSMGRERTEHALLAKRSGVPFEIMDEDKVLDFFFEKRNEKPEKLVEAFLSEPFFGLKELRDIPGFSEIVSEKLRLMREGKVREALL